MITTQFTPPQAALVAIDIAKNRHEVWPVPGLEDTELGVFMKPEEGHGTTAACTGVQA